MVLLVAIAMFSSCKKENPTPAYPTIVKSYSTNMSGTLIVNGKELVVATNVSQPTNITPTTVTLPTTISFNAESTSPVSGVYCFVTINKNNIDTTINLPIVCDTAKGKFGVVVGFNYGGQATLQ